MSRILGADDIAVARQALKRGELVAFPTETVYGLGADARNPEAIRAVFAVKGRPASHPLIVHIGHRDQLAAWAAPDTPHLKTLTDMFWPGPLTVIVRHGGRADDAITGGQDTVGLRMPDHPLTLELLGRDLALVGPSANLYGHVSPTTAGHVAAELGGQVPFIIDGGPSQVGLESTIIDLTAAFPRILRPGMISSQAIAEALTESVSSVWSPDSPRTPGSLPSHYAPGSEVQLVGEAELTRLLEAGGVTAVMSLQPPPAGFAGAWESLPSTAAGYARELYAALRRLDTGRGLILVELPPQLPGWEAVHDRLQRASASREVNE